MNRSLNQTERRRAVIASARLPGPVAYLVSEYPKASHTFIQREVAGLRALGAEVHTLSIRRVGAEHHIGPEEQAAARETFVALDAARNPLRLATSHLRLLVRRPRGWLSALALAARTAEPGLRGGLWRLFHFAEAGILADRLRRTGAVHLHVHFGNAACMVGMLAARMAGLPYSYTLHGPSELFEPQTQRLADKVANAAFVACISWFARSQAMLFADPAHWPKLKIVHCGVDPARYDRPRRRAADGPAELLFVGRLAAVKGVVVLFDALERLRARGVDARLTLVGDGPERARLEREAAARGLDGTVRLVGHQSQEAVAERLAAADLFVLPSFAEGVPVVLMEAMASRAAVVATRVAGVPELVEDGVSGRLVPPGDAEGLADALAALIADPALRARMGEAGRSKVAAEHDAAREAAWLLQIIASVHGGPQPAGVRP
jgi:glycosyltransferase involved in cell wall biosynthesis